MGRKGFSKRRNGEWSVVAKSNLRSVSVGIPAGSLFFSQGLLDGFHHRSHACKFVLQGTREVL